MDKGRILFIGRDQLPCVTEEIEQKAHLETMLSLTNYFI